MSTGQNQPEDPVVALPRFHVGLWFRTAVRSRVVILVAACLAMLVVGVLMLPQLRSPGTDRELYQQGLSALERRDYAQVRGIIGALESRRPPTEFADLLQATFQLRSNSHQSALQTLLALNLTGPLRQDILLLSGEAFYRAGQLADARQALSTLLAEAPDCVDAHRWLASTWYDLGANIPAIHHLTEVTRLAPDDYRPHWLMGVMYRDFENFPEAIRHLRAAWDRNPPTEVRDLVGVYLSRSLQADHQYEVALEFLKKCQPGPAVQVETARAEFSLTRVEVAEELLKKTSIPDEEQAGIDYFLLYGEILEARGDLQQAVEKYASGAARFPFDEDLQYRFAIALKAAGDTSGSESAMAEWNRRNELKKRLVELNKTASEQPDNADVRRQLAEICRRMNRPQLAAMWEAAAVACGQRSGGAHREDPGADSAPTSAP
ncbi:MAG: tetratricopeptide repeat protein [Planctomycetota bacterium]